MKQLLKPSINFDFKDVIFEDTLTQKLYSKQNKAQFNHQYRKDEDIRNQKTNVRPWSSQRQMTDQYQGDQNQQLNGKNSKQNKQKQHFTQNMSAKQMKFDKNQVCTTSPSIQSNCYFPQQQHNILKKYTTSSQQQIIQQQLDNQNNNKLLQQNQDIIKNAGIFDWDDNDFENQFYITNKQYESIEKLNQEKFIQKQQNPDVIQISIKQNQEILKQQQKEILQKFDNIEQLRMNEKLKNNQVISQQPFLDTVKQNDNIKEGKLIQQTPINNIQKFIHYEQEYDQESFEIDEENKVDDKQNKTQKKLQDNDVKQSKIKLDKVQDNSKKVKSNESLIKTSSQNNKQVIYRAKNAKERKQELINMRSDFEKYLLQNNEAISKMFQELQDTKDKERIMIEINTKRQEELSQARLTLKQLQEKFSRQQQIIEDLNQKEHYANQIIQKLTEKKQQYNQQWEHQMEKYMACKVIARFFKGKRDRKLYTEFRRQSFINRLKQ
ncbi:unnamed protein product [Paramecium primaurelia]|uniref:Uncharacterized protein n=1 Tax=Paramecium primaurelia TaxID=5886 RepID=A0A8S1P6B2_PARPR|nr:unnamed protein product [Paramecium primaurelia]